MERTFKCSVAGIALLALWAICLSGCGGPAAEKPTAARKTPAEPAAESGKPTEYAPAIAKQVPAESAATPSADTAPEPAANPDKPAGQVADTTAPANTPAPAEPIELAAKPKPAPKLAPKPATVPKPAPKAPEPPKEIGQVDPADLIMPAVLLTQGETKTCLVKVGDMLPDIRLPNAKGIEETLKDLFGERLTVVVFWKATHPYAVEELGDLQHYVADRFAAKGVKIVGIDIEDQPPAVEAAVEAQKVLYPNLIDATGAAFAQVATGLVPRTYLVDATGKILWFDMEYSRSTRRDLLRAIRATLATSE